MSNVSDKTNHGTVASYSTGFGLSIVLTLAAYLLTTHQVAEGWSLILVLATLAVVQLVVQLVFFLHISSERRPRWNLTVALFAIMVVIIIVFGSLWIMKNLNYDHQHVQPVNQPDQAIIKDEGYQQ